MKNWQFYTTNQLKPAGWIKRQLEIQAKGLSGNLDKIWPDVRDSAWIGGDREGWERVPYWLDGFIPLAYLLEDEDMIRRAQTYIEAILAGQCEDGWICPCSEAEREGYDTWAIQLISKVLLVYHKCSGDQRIPSVLEKLLYNYYELLSAKKIKLFDWAKSRWFETFLAIRFLYQKNPQPWMKALAKILYEQGCDYLTLTDRWKRPLNRWTQQTHIVNLAMMLKAEAISFDLLDEEYVDRAETLRTVLDRYNGTVYESFTGDECLSGLSPIQGTELCAIVEQMYSYELLYACTGEAKWAERLEVLAFNALPATISEDMWTHQYVQMSNQIACERFPGKPLFRTNGSESHLFGLEPNYGCCTANFNQGWPKLVLFSFLHRDNTILSSLMVPSVLKTDEVTISLATNYPFENRMTYTIEAEKAFDFAVRIPSFAEKVFVNGKETDEREPVFSILKGETVLEIAFETTPYFKKRPYDLYAVQCGSLLFSLPIRYRKELYEYEKDGVERKFPYCDYELIPESDWNYAFSDSSLQKEEHGVGEIPFSESMPPVTVTTKVRQIPWGLEDGYETVCAKLPESRVPVSDACDAVLIPYGCTKLRMTELPVLE